MRRRVFAFLMALVMLISTVPGTAFAETEDAYQVGATVTNDGSAAPEGAIVENSYWARTDYAAVYSCATEEEHEHSMEAGCELVTAAYTVWTLTALTAEGEENSSEAPEDEEVDSEIPEGETEGEAPDSESPEGEADAGDTSGDEADTGDTSGDTDTTDTSDGGLSESVEVTEEAPDPAAAAATYTVQFTARDSDNKELRYVQIMITSEDGTVSYITTNDRGSVSTTLAEGTYTAVISYTSGSYIYYAAETFTVSGSNMSVTLTTTETMSSSAAQNVYDRTTYFNHVDIRVKGTYTTGTTTDLTTYNIKLQNVSIEIVNPESDELSNYTVSFTNNSETYEWRKTDIRVDKTAVVSLVCDIVDSETGEVLKYGFTYSFSGEDAFIQAIINCDANQGLDFIIDPQEIIEAVFYDVSYQWKVINSDGSYSELPAGIATLPATATNYESGDLHTIDTVYREGYYVIVESEDGTTATAYQFYGWDWWSHVADNNLTQNVFGSDAETLTVTDDSIIFGVWRTFELEKASSHMTITKQFLDEEGNAMTGPAGYTVQVTGPLGGTYNIPLSMFTYDETTGVYTHNLAVYSEGRFTVAETGYSIDGYDFESAAVAVTDSGDGHLSNIVKSDDNTSVSFDVELHWKQAGTEEVSTSDEAEHDVLGQVDFDNSYEKVIGSAVHNYPNLTVDKLDADTWNELEGATFQLEDANGAVVNNANGTPMVGTSNESGYIVFPNLLPGTYYLVETQAPEGYLAGYAEYRVEVTLKEGYPTQILYNGAWCDYYEYDIMVYARTSEAEGWYESQHFSVGNTTHRFRLAAFNEKINGQLTITKTFAGVEEEHYPESITVTVEKPDGTTEDVVLNSGNNWTATLTGLELGTYYVTETAPEITGYIFSGLTYTGINAGSTNAITISEDDLVADYAKNDPIAAEEVGLVNTYIMKEDDAYLWPKLTVKKVRDTDHKVHISGVEFTIYRDAALTDPIATGTTNHYGEITFDFSESRYGLEAIMDANGADTDVTFYLVETEAADTYAQNDTVYQVFVYHIRSGDPELGDGMYITDHTYGVNVYVDGALMDVNDVLTVENTKDEGSLTITKSFGVNNAYIPDSVQINVSVTGGDYSETFTLSAANNWKITIDGLALDTEYTVTEINGEKDGYELDINYGSNGGKVTLTPENEQGQVDITNTYYKIVVNPASFQVKKVDESGNILRGAVFTLYSDETCETVVKELSTGADGIATFAGFTEAATYYLKETAPVSSDYEPSTMVWKVTVSLRDGDPEIKINANTNIWESIYNWIAGVDSGNWENGVLTVVNVKKTGSLTITKEVAYVDENGDAIANAPETAYQDASYTFTVTYGGTSVDKSIKAGESWTIENIPYGTTYTITEQTSGALFTSSLTSENNSGTISAETTSVTVTNTYKYVTHTPGLNILKVDDSANAQPVAGAGFTLYTDDKCETAYGVEVTSDADGKLNLPITAEGTYYLVETTTPSGYHANTTVYTVTAAYSAWTSNGAGTDAPTRERTLEVTVAGLNTTAVSGTVYYKVVNTAIKTVTLSVTKDWKDGGYWNRPESLSVTLYRDGGAYQTVTLTAANSWTYTWDASAGLTDAYTWTVDEPTVPAGYTKTSVTDDGSGNWTIVNTRPEGKVNITVTKAWKHNGGKDLPESVVITLYKDGTAYESVTLSEKNNWTYTWSELSDVYKWSVDEVEVPEGYEKKITSVDGCEFTVTNTRIIQDVTVSVTKKWADGDKPANVSHPTSVQVALYRDGVKYQTVTLSASNNWSYTWDDLTDEYTWSVDEPTVPSGYIKKVDTTVSSGTDGIAYSVTITNTYNTNPKTGDDFHMGMWGMTMGISAAMMFILLILGGDKKKGKYQA